MTASIQLSISSGPVGSIVGITGSGFDNNTAFTVTFIDAVTSIVITLYVGTTTSGGLIPTSPITSFIIPVSSLGVNSIKVTEGTNTPTASFATTSFTPTLGLKNDGDPFFAGDYNAIVKALQLISSPIVGSLAATVKEPDYIVYEQGGTYYAISGLDNSIDFTNSDASTVIQSAMDALVEGGIVFLKEIQFVYSLSIPANVSIVESYNGELRTFINVVNSTGSPFSVSTDGVNYFCQDSGKRIINSFTSITLSTLEQSVFTLCTSGLIYLNNVALASGLTISPTITIMQELDNVLSVYSGKFLIYSSNTQSFNANTRIYAANGVTGLGIGVIANTLVNISSTDTQTINGHTGYRIISGFSNLTNELITNCKVLSVNLYNETEAANVASGGRFWLQRWGGSGGGMYIFDSQDWVDIANAQFILWYINLQPITVASILCIGDSITFGVGTSTPYPSVLQAATGITTSNDGVGGAQTPTILANWEIAKVSGYGAVVFEGGVNDIIYSYGIESEATLEANLKQMWIEALNLGMKVYALTITPAASSSGWTSGQQTMLLDVNNWIRANAPLYGVVVVDTYTLLNDPSNDGHLVTTYNSGDGLHPNQTGANIIARAVALAMGKDNSSV